MLLKFLALFSTLSSFPLLAAEIFSVTDLKEDNLSSSMMNSFEKNGYLIIKDFFDSSQINEALSEYKSIVRKFPEHHLGEHFFETTETAVQSSDQYFFDSADEVWPFYNSSFKENRHVVQLDLCEEENLLSYLKVMNKVGHNLHGKNAFFQDLVLKNQRLKNIARQLHYDDPSTALYQTTIISKSSVEDSRYSAHQDGTFIGAKGNVLAYWIPLTPSTKENGCLWGIPGSHKLPITWWYRLENEQVSTCTFKGERPDWDLTSKVYLEVNPGDLLIFPGSFIHGSDAASKKSKSIDDLRIALTYHLGPTTAWDELTWLKLTPRNVVPLFKD